MTLEPGSPSTTDAAILAAIGDVAREHLGWTGPLGRDTPLVEVLALDSIRQLTLVIEIENHFRIRLDDEEAGAVRTAGDLVDAIRRGWVARDGDAR